MELFDYLLAKKASGGGSSSYSDLSDKPKINNVELVGNKTTSDLGIVIPDVSNIFILDNSKLNDTSMYQKFAEAIRKCANEQSGMSIIYQVNINAYLLNAAYEQIQRFATGTSASGQITFSTDVKRVVLHQYRTMTAIRVNYKYDTITSITETNETRSYQTLGTDNTLLYTPTTDYNPATKKYVDDKPTTYTGYDATKTQVLKNINGTLTWVDEV